MSGVSTKIVICWDEISGYMAACWRDLARRENVDLFVLAFPSSVENHTQFRPNIMDGIEHRLLDRTERNDKELVRNIVVEQNPEVLVLSGWNHTSYVQVAFEPSLKDVFKVMTMDNNRQFNLRQAVARLKIGRYLDLMDSVFVAGERSWQLAKYLKIPEYKIHRGCYGIDYQRFSRLLDRRLEECSEWPRCFLFIGQYIARKGLDILLEAYKQYRNIVADPWALKCCGSGPVAKLLDSMPGVYDLGFLQPEELVGVIAQSGAFVLPSRFDAWGVVIAETGASGLPIICSEACAGSVELVRPLYNGITVPSGDVESLSSALLWLHENYHELPEMGRRSRELTMPYAAEFWADRLLKACKHRTR